MAMASAGALVVLMALFALVLSAQAQGLAPAPAPANDGTSIDQGVAYVLMFAALVLTYLIHPMDAAASSFGFF